MSTNKTQNYNLHSWVPEDDFLRSEFNDNFTSLDTALKALSTALTAETTAREQAIASEASARQSAVSAEQSARQSAITTLTTGKAEIVTGSYEGDGAKERAITLGFQPKAVLLMEAHGRTYPSDSSSSASFGGLILPGKPIQVYAGTAAEITATGFTVHRDGYAYTNDNRFTYYYIAVK